MWIYSVFNYEQTNKKWKRNRYLGTHCNCKPPTTCYFFTCSSLVCKLHVKIIVTFYLIDINISLNIKLHKQQLHCFSVSNILECSSLVAVLFHVQFTEHSPQMQFTVSRSPNAWTVLHSQNSDCLLVVLTALCNTPLHNIPSKIALICSDQGSKTQLNKDNSKIKLTIDKILYIIKISVFPALNILGNKELYFSWYVTASFDVTNNSK